ncbi:hypothetical protein [Nannocystis sp. SCPEA4]|uniref:sodium:solute symporter family transporter n=1 Tax=Nannocystis sp. SCPEA4 TaxID=2996787 RepID=UPI00226E0529|nr:hypothetical protein [Nannocystis sp. SCPEA4]
MLDLVLVLAFIAYSVNAGLRARRLASRDLGEYFLAGRTLRGWQAGASMAATQFAADTPLLVTGLVAVGGLGALWLLWIYGLSFLLLAYVFAGPWRRAKVLTDAELVELRYGGRGSLALRLCKALYYGGVLNCAALAMVLVGAVRFTEVFLPWHAWLPAGWIDPLARVVGQFGGGFVASSAVAPEVAGADALISVVVLMGFTALYSMTARAASGGHHRHRPAGDHDGRHGDLRRRGAGRPRRAGRDRRRAGGPPRGHAGRALAVPRAR